MSFNRVSWGLVAPLHTSTWRCVRNKRVLCNGGNLVIIHLSILDTFAQFRTQI